MRKLIIEFLYKLLSLIAKTQIKTFEQAEKMGYEKIFTRQEISQMDLKTFMANEEIIFQQLYLGLIK